MAIAATLCPKESKRLGLKKKSFLLAKSSQIFLILGHYLLKILKQIVKNQLN